ncbi:MAG: TetR/AcrR family transcriptional regulator [Deltaproteobacteria bacterium]|nr:TetR/AcrR family transcriptional regulator [Deltaproteobacteria bacterium]
MIARTTELRQRRDQARKQLTREALLDASERVFALRGYHRTQVSDIVSEAKVGQGTFYRHFQSKRVLFDALFDRLTSGLLGGFEAPVGPLPETLGEYREMSLRGAIQATRVIEEHAAALRIILRDGPSIDDAFAARLEAVYGQMSQIGRIYLDHAVKKGLVPAQDTELVGHVVVGYAIRVLTLWLDGRLPERSSEDVVRKLVDFSVLGFAGQLPFKDVSA